MFNLTISAVTPPDGLPHTDRKTEIMELPSYLRVTGASGSSSLKMVYVGTTAPGPDNIDNVWLKTDEAGTAHGFYRFDTTLGTWMLMAGPGVVCASTAPKDTNVIWLKNDGSIPALELYHYVGTEWILFTTVPIVYGGNAPTNTTSLWLKPSLLLYRYDDTPILDDDGLDTGADVGWVLFTTLTINHSTLAPTDTTDLWLKADSLNATKGLYQYVDGEWTNMASTTEIINSTIEPPGVADTYWLKSDDVTKPRGLYFWNGSAWVNGTSIGGGGASGQGASYVVTSATAPAASIRNHVLWAKIGNAPLGLFRYDSVNSRWESLHPIIISLQWPSTGTVTLETGYSVQTNVPYSILCPTIGTAVFAIPPLVSFVLESDSQFSTTGGFLTWGIVPGLSSFTIGFWNPIVSRNIVCRISATEIMRIPV